VRSPLETFAGLLDRSVQEIAASAADARTVDLSRIGLIADIWDNNTFPLVSAACAPRLMRTGRARAGLRWMADLGAARRELMVDLDPALDTMLPAVFPGAAVYRDYRGLVRPGSFPVTAETSAGLEADYDLSAASLRSLAVWPGRAGLCASLTLAAPRRFTPSTGRMARDGTRKPWPPALLAFTFTDVGELAFDADDRTGAAITVAAGTSLAIGRSGHVQAASATVHCDDPCWHESTAGRAADTVTPHEREARRKPVQASTLAGQERAAARALFHLMLRIRLVGYHPGLAGRIPVRELCEATAGAGTAILRAGARRGSARRTAFAGLEQRWRHLPPDAAPAPVPAAPASLRYARYSEPHHYFDNERPGQAILVAATPDTDPAAPWRLASEEIAQPALFHITGAAFNGVSDVHRDSSQLALGDRLVIHGER
jgi:hypothetical protein